nr:helix-turn-helix domain-containing protein [Actinokineospora enzanensis]
MAARLGVGERQLNRRCQGAFGYGAKVLHRVLRFQGAVRMARGGGSFADVADRCGYADQAHMAREVRGFSGGSLRLLVG